MTTKANTREAGMTADEAAAVLDALELASERDGAAYVDDIMEATFPHVRDLPETDQYIAYAKAAMSEYGHLISKAK